MASQADRQEEAKKKADEARTILEGIGKLKDAVLNPPISDDSEAIKQARKRLPINPAKITREDAISWLKDPDLDAATIRQVYKHFPDVKRRIYEVTNMPDINEIEQRLLRVEKVLKGKGWLNDEQPADEPSLARLELDRDPVVMARIRNENG